MKSIRTGWLLVMVGVIMLGLSALAEPIGLGNSDGVGLKQTTGVIVGALVAAVGAFVVWRQRPGTKRAQPD